MKKKSSSVLRGNGPVPPFYLRNPVLQTVMSSLKIRNSKEHPFDKAGREIIVDAGEGVRLSGYLTGSPVLPKRGIIILIHGWEGSEKSAYMVAGGRYFYSIGYDIFRLNMRDHGNSHHLNEGPFLGTLIEEAYGAVQKIITDYATDREVFVIGFSMGANFALRIASLAGKEKSGCCIKRIIAVNPPLDPFSATARIDRYFILKKYFLKKWRRSLLKKQNAFPDLYDFKKVFNTDSCLLLTEKLVDEYSEYNDLKDYFSRYTLKRDFFKGINCPVTVITAYDDPVIDIKDFEEIKKAENDMIDLCIQSYGGHCAYIRDLKLNTWLFDLILEKIT